MNIFVTKFLLDSLHSELSTLHSHDYYLKVSDIVDINDVRADLQTLLHSGDALLACIACDHCEAADGPFHCTLQCTMYVHNYTLIRSVTEIKPWFIV